MAFHARFWFALYWIALTSRYAFVVGLQILGLVTWLGSLANGQNDLSPSTEDRVVYGPALPRSPNVWSPPAAIVFTGKIEKLDQNFLEIVTTAGKRHKLTSDRIERIDLAWHSPEAAAAHTLFATQQYAAALKEMEDVLRAGGIPLWQQWQLLSELVQAADALDRTEIAGERFLLLARFAPPDYMMATMPLNWISREITPALQKAAAGWMSQPDDFAGLLGASWLLLTDRAEEATQRLERIRTSDSKLLQRLATMQLWRAVPPSETTGVINRWITARDSLLLPLQMGPSEFLAERLARVERTNLAVGEWLRIAATHEEYPPRATAALKAAALLLSRSDNKASFQSATDWIEEFVTPTATGAAENN